MPIPVIMDCDPGHDDAIALVLAYACPEIEILAVTTSAGNQTIDKTTLNARKVLSFLGCGAPVARGASKPLFRELIIAPQVHGESGLDGPALPEPTSPESPMSAVELAAKTIRECDRGVTIVATAALTNVAALLLAHPELKSKIERISLMGGSAVGGNWTPAAEFNILVDPEAAQIVFNAGIPVTMCGLDVTHQALVTRADTERFRVIGGRCSTMVAELLDFFVKFHEANFDFGGSPLHDPCAVAWLVDPGIFVSRKAHVDVECRGRHTTGATVVDFGGVSGGAMNVDVVTGLDLGRFIDLLDSALRRLDRGMA
ncbi:MAG: pyrimidine-specific ribonucleoside hydrolase RihA [Spirochaetae bacterium HGW-Spirochaetae-7]|jgi:pyrimidine-specific ribonucleoside hydrolase|nr:MAG: pyrimidine-specific ribonucleoside hydrolase RihA [Spirochaetae bacterium HGW-Spirochaetae-7]